MTPRLRMNSPCTYNLDAARSVDVSSYMDRLGFFSGMSQAWEKCVRRLYDDFDASFAASEGIEAIIRDLAPSRRRLTVNRISRSCYSIECEQGAKLFLTATDDDSIILSFNQQSADEDNIDLAFYDSFEAARFIGNAFRAYRMILENFRRKLSDC